MDELARAIAHSADFWQWMSLLIASVPAALFYGFLRLRHARAVRDNPTAKIRSAHQGYVELEGVGRIIDFGIASPLTGTECLWWWYRVEEEVPGLDGKRRWQTREQFRSEEPFWLEDATGRCRIHPRGAEIVDADERRWFGDVRDDGRAVGHRGRGPWRFTERFLWRDQPLYVIGDFRTVNQDPAGDRKAAASAKLAAWKRDPGRMKQFDVDRSGEVDFREWGAAVRVAQRQAEREVPLREAGPVHTLSDHDGGHFVISARPQRDLAARYSVEAKVCLTWFVVGGALVVWLLQARFAG